MNGSEKRRVRRSIKQLQRVKTWQLIILLLLAGFIAATFLRLNNIGMIERRKAVIAADEAGDTAVITQRLYDLQRYVSAHMNTDLGRGVYLESSFSRDLQKWQSIQYGDTNSNGNVYAEVQKICEPQFRSYSTAYLQCTTSELAKYPPSQTTVNESSKPRSDTYIQAFASPTWSPDFAGWSLVVCVLIALMIVVRLITLAVLSLMLRRHYRDA